GGDSGAPHPAAKLVELCVTQHVRPVDDHRVHVRDVHAVLDDGGGEEHLALAVHEAPHHLLQLVVFHLAVPYRYGDLRHEHLEGKMDGLDRLHPVVQIEH